MIFTVFLNVAYAENSDYSINGKYHDYKIKLDFIDGLVQGKITNNNEIITLDNPKLIERDSGFLIVDKENNLKILSKKVSNDKYIILVKIKPDTKLRFIGIMDTVNKNTGQRDLVNAMDEKQKLDEELRIKNMSFRELELYKKQQLIEKSSKQFKGNVKRITEDSYKKTFGNLTRDSILEEYEKSKIKTGMDLSLNKKIIKPKVTKIDNIILHVLTSHYDKVNNDNGIFVFEVKTFDKNVYDGTEWNKFDGRIDDVLISAKMKDSDGNIKKEFSGYTKYGIFKGQQKINGSILYPQGNYSLEIDVTFKNQKFSQTLYFVVFSDYDSYNNRPISNAGVDGHFKSGYVVTLDGSNSFDSDDKIIYYNWNQIGGETVTLSNNKIINPSFIIPDIFDSFIFELIVDDGRKETRTPDIVEITSLHSDAGMNQIHVNATDGFLINSTNIILDGSMSGDVISEHVTNFLWTVESWATASTIRTENLTDNTRINPEFMPDQFGDYVLQLKFSDDEGLTDIDKVTITVNP